MKMAGLPKVPLGLDETFVIREFVNEVPPSVEMEANTSKLGDDSLFV